MDLIPVPLDQNGLEIFRQRHSEARSQQWPRMQRLYHAKSYGPTTFSGPTIIVLDRHEMSTDSILFSCVKSYGASAARRDNTYASKLAEYLGGPIYDEKKAGLPQLNIGRRILFLLLNGCTIFIIPFTDVHKGKLSTRVLELAYHLEVRGKVGEISYVPATVRYSGAYPFLGPLAHLRAFPSYRAIQYVTKAEVFISDSPVKLAQLPDESRSFDGLVSKIFEQAKALPERYLSGQK